jgi:hypothetical protein
VQIQTWREDIGMKTFKLGKLIYCNTRVRHDLAIFDEPARHIVWRFWWSD